ncbi:MAG: acyl-CoA synthetase [Candidatus Paracaedibacteraceae bacterium]|nr:acyl-CoA synthetase [Candidatus Paracaedibacteraceae bacterium]
MAQLIKFIPLTHVLVERTPAEWQFIFGDDHPIAQDFLTYCAAVHDYLVRKNPKRVIIIAKDRALFLVYVLVAFRRGIDVVLPHFQTSGVLADICEQDDLILDDDTNFTLSQGVVDWSPVQGGTISLYTSGSTGKPKEIRKSIHQLQAELNVLHSLWGRTIDLRVWATVSHHHIYGLLFSLLWPVCAGYRIEARTLNFWEEIADLTCSDDFIVSSPAHLSRLGSLGSIPCARVFSSGAPLSFEAAQVSLSVFGSLPHEILGSTETGGIAYRQQHQMNQPWQAFPGLEISVNATSNLVLKSPYLPTEDAYESADQIDLLATGVFTLTGRSDRVVKIEGKRIDLLDLEKRLCDMAAITQALTVVFDEGRSEIGVVAILSDEGQNQLNNLGGEKFSRSLRNELSVYFERIVLPRRWRFVQDFPRDSQGKCPSYLLKSLFDHKG